MRRSKRTVPARFGIAILALLAVPLHGGAQSKPPGAVVTSPASRSTVADPALSVGTVRVPDPLERSNALAKIGLQPTRLQLGQAVNYSLTHLDDRDGRISVSCASVFKVSGQWVFVSLGNRVCTTVITLEFATQPGKQYVLDFAFDPSWQGEFSTRGFESDTPLTVAAVDGHLTRLVTGNGATRRVRIDSIGDRNFAFFYVKVIPLSS